MTDDEFDAVVAHRISRIQAVLGEKAKEYSYGGDRLSNFHRAADIQKINPEQAAWNFLVKHLVSIQDMIESGTHYHRGRWCEKLGDAINYLILIDAIVIERGDP